MSPRPPRKPLLHAVPDATLDLHGHTVAEAEDAVLDFLEAESRLGKGRIVHVMTGKGTGTLFRAVGELLDHGVRTWVDESAPDLQGAGYRVRVR